MDYIYSFLFGVFPYLAMTVAVVGCYYRFRYVPRSVKTSSSQIFHGKSLMIGSILFHIGILNLLAGHVFGLLTPHQIYEAFGLTTPMKQQIEIVMGFLMTPPALIGLSILIWRRVAITAVKKNNAKGDIALLSLIWIQLMIGFVGIFFSLGHMDDGGANMLKLTGWFQGLFIAQPDNWKTIVDVNPIYQAHIVIGFVFFLILPFTRLIHVIAGGMLGEYLLRPYQIVRQSVWSKEGRK